MTILKEMTEDHVALKALLERAVARHGDKLVTYVAVAITENGARPLGFCTGSDLGIALEVLDNLASNLPPDDCANCSATIQALGIAAQVYRQVREKILADHSPGFTNAHHVH